MAVSAAAVATAVAVVLYANVGQSSIGDIEKGDEKKSSKKKKAKTSKSTKPEPFDPNGPILEEVRKDEGPTCKAIHILLTVIAHTFFSVSKLLKHFQTQRLMACLFRFVYHNIFRDHG